MGISTVISVTSCSKGPEIPVSTYYEAKTSSEIIEKIDNIGEATLANEGLIEAIYVNYTNLTDEEQALVTNYEKLDDARNAVTQLYFPEKKTDQRFDRSKIQIGTYAVNNASEENVQWLNDAGINFICRPNESKEALDMYEKYGIGAFLRMKPYWNV